MQDESRHGYWRSYVESRLTFKDIENAFIAGYGVDGPEAIERYIERLIEDKTRWGRGGEDAGNAHGD